jgi:hypothetical protein
MADNCFSTDSMRYETHLLTMVHSDLSAGQFAGNVFTGLVRDHSVTVPAALSLLRSDGSRRG